MQVDGRTTVTVSQAMARCGVSRRTIYNWLAKNKIEWTRTPGGAPRIFEDSLGVGQAQAGTRTFVARSSGPPAPPPPSEPHAILAEIGRLWALSRTKLTPAAKRQVLAQIRAFSDLYQLATDGSSGPPRPC